MPAPDERRALVVPALCGVEQVVGRVAIHQDLAGDHQGAVAVRFLEERVDRLRMDRAVHGGRRRPGPQQFAEEQRRDGLRMCLVGELPLRDEGVFVQPREQLFAIGADHLHLRIMDVGVDEARADDRVGIMGHHDVFAERGAQRRVIADGRDRAAVDNDERVLEEDERFGASDLERIVAEGDRATA